MDDEAIVRLYWARNEEAIPETARKYGRYCYAIAHNILGSREDAEECVNDAYLSAWNAIPPHRPHRLAAFLGKITRNLSLNRRKYRGADKRAGDAVALALDELAECVGQNIVDEAVDGNALARELDRFLEGQPAQRRIYFVRRYWYLDSVSAIAARCGVSENSVSVTLNRMRKSLKAYLCERGYSV